MFPLYFHSMFMWVCTCLSTLCVHYWRCCRQWTRLVCWKTWQKIYFKKINKYIKSNCKKSINFKLFNLTLGNKYWSEVFAKRLQVRSRPAGGAVISLAGFGSMRRLKSVFAVSSGIQKKETDKRARRESNPEGKSAWKPKVVLFFKGRVSFWYYLILICNRYYSFQCCSFTCYCGFTQSHMKS